MNTRAELTVDEAGKLAGRLCDLYIARTDRYLMGRNGAIFMPKDKSGMPRQLSRRTVFGHVMQRYSISVYAPEAGSKFFCFDADDGGEIAVHALLKELAVVGIPME